MKIIYRINFVYLIAVYTFIFTFHIFHKVQSQCLSKDDLVLNLPNYKKEELPCMYSGYISISEQTNSKMFYWLFMDDVETPSKAKPLVVWLSGGVSSLFSLFTEIGPLKINNKGEFSVDKTTSWITKANILYVDQPIGTGYSFTTDLTSIPKNQNTISQHFYKFIQRFLILHSNLTDKNFYLMGDSYSGMYIPNIAKLILEENKKIDAGDSHNQKINLKKISVGNGIFDLKFQGLASKDLAKGLNFVSEFDDEPQFDLLTKRCENALSTISTKDTQKECNKVQDYLKGIAGDIDHNDVRKSAEFETLDTRYLTNYLNRLDVITALNIKDSIMKKENYWSLFNLTVHNSLIDDYNFNSSLPVIEYLLNDFNIPVIIYAGQFDIFDGPQGIERALHTLNYKNSENWKNSTREHWKIPLEGTNKYVLAGYIKQHGNLIFVSMRKAGHLVPRDRPVTSLNLLEHILSDEINIKCPDDNCSLAKIKCNAMENCSGNGICAENTGGKCICNHEFFGPDCSMKTELLLSKNKVALAPSEVRLFDLSHYPSDVILEIESEDHRINVSFLDKLMHDHLYDIRKHMISYRLDTHKLSLIVEREKFDKYLIVITNLEFKHSINLKFFVTPYSKC